MATSLVVPVSGPWAAGPTQPWASYDTLGEGFSNLGAQPTEGGQTSFNAEMG